MPTLANPGSFGTGWSFPIAATADGTAIATSSDNEKIVQSIWLILTTAPGERVMRSDFGCGLNRLVFALLGDALIGQVINEVKTALARWEPRIQVLAVDAVPDASQPNLLLITIDYTVASTNSRYNLVYPFYVS